MKKLILISALLLTITGCVTLKTSHDTPLMAELGEVKIVDSYENLGMSVSGSATYRFEAMSTTTGEKFFYRFTYGGYNALRKVSLQNRALNACRDVFNSDCVITRVDIAKIGSWGKKISYGEAIFYTSLDDYKEKKELAVLWSNKEEMRLTLLKEQQRQEQLRQEEQQRQEKERIVAELRERCASYGFSGDENIAACIQREAQHDLELAQQKRELQLAQQRLTYQNRQAQVVEEEIPWWMEFLGAVAEGVAEGYAHDAIHHNDKPKVIYRNCDVYKC